MSLTCVVPSAGKGSRLRLRKDKPFVSLLGKPLLARTLSVLNKSNAVESIIVSVGAQKIKETDRLVKKYRLRKVKKIIKGGSRRFNSVKNALKAVKECDFIMVHDGARPFLSESLIRSTLKAAGKYGSAIAALPVTDTLKVVNKRGISLKTPDRKCFWMAQTPQIFKKEIIMKAYESAGKGVATDDSSLVEALGYKVKLVKGSPRNIKITTAEDLELAKTFLRKKR